MRIDKDIFIRAVAQRIADGSLPPSIGEDLEAARRGDVDAIVRIQEAVSRQSAGLPGTAAGGADGYADAKGAPGGAGDAGALQRSASMFGESLKGVADILATNRAVIKQLFKLDGVDDETAGLIAEMASWDTDKNAAIEKADALLGAYKDLFSYLMDERGLDADLARFTAGLVIAQGDAGNAEKSRAMASVYMDWYYISSKHIGDNYNASNRLARRVSKAIVGHLASGSIPARGGSSKITVNIIDAAERYLMQHYAIVLHLILNTPGGMANVAYVLSVAEEVIARNADRFTIMDQAYFDKRAHGDNKGYRTLMIEEAIWRTDEYLASNPFKLSEGEKEEVKEFLAGFQKFLRDQNRSFSQSASEDFLPELVLYALGETDVKSAKAAALACSLACNYVMAYFMLFFQRDVDSTEMEALRRLIGQMALVACYHYFRSDPDLESNASIELHPYAVLRRVKRIIAYYKAAKGALTEKGHEEAAAAAIAFQTSLFSIHGDVAIEMAGHYIQNYAGAKKLLIGKGIAEAHAVDMALAAAFKWNADDAIEEAEGLAERYAAALSDGDRGADAGERALALLLGEGRLRPETVMKAAARIEKALVEEGNGPSGKESGGGGQKPGGAASAAGGAAGQAPKAGGETGASARPIGGTVWDNSGAQFDPDQASAMQMDAQLSNGAMPDPVQAGAGVFYGAGIPPAAMGPAAIGLYVPVGAY